MELNEQQRLALRAALIRLSSDQSWTMLRTMAEEAVYALEQKSLQEDDEAKAKTFRADARGARKFWQKWLRAIELAQSGQGTANENFLEVVMD